MKTKETKAFRNGYDMMSGLLNHPL